MSSNTVKQKAFAHCKSLRKNVNNEMDCEIPLSKMRDVDLSLVFFTSNKCDALKHKAIFSQDRAKAQNLRQQSVDKQQKIAFRANKNPA